MVKVAAIMAAASLTLTTAAATAATPKLPAWTTAQASQAVLKSNPQLWGTLTSLTGDKTPSKVQTADCAGTGKPAKGRYGSFRCQVGYTASGTTDEPVTAAAVVLYAGPRLGLPTACFSTGGLAAIPLRCRDEHAPAVWTLPQANTAVAHARAHVPGVSLFATVTGAKCAGVGKPALPRMWLRFTCAVAYDYRGTPGSITVAVTQSATLEPVFSRA